MIGEPRHTNPNDDPAAVQRDTMRREDDRYPRDDARDDLTRDDMGRNDMGRNDTVTGVRDSDPRHPDTAVRTDPTMESHNGARNTEPVRATETRATDSRATDTVDSGNGHLIPPERAKELDARWSAIKGEFVDEPRKAVTDADQLVGEFLDELQQSLNHRRQTIGESLAAESTSTESMRTALHDYRTMIDRLLATESR